MSSSVVSLSVGATEAQIQSALNNLADGGTLVLAAGQTIEIRNGLVMDVSTRSITLDLNGSTLQQAGDVSVLTARGAHAAGQTATLGRDATNQVTVTTSGNAPVAAVGEWVKVYSDSLLPNDYGSDTRLGQAMQVVGVNGNSLVLKGELFDAGLYVENIRVSKYVGGTSTIENGTVRGDQSHADWTKDLVQLRSTVNADINHLTVRDGNSMGINIVDSVNAKVSQTAVINLTDDPVTGHNGYAVHSANSYGTTVEGLYAQNVRHATDNNAVGVSANSLDVARYGADIAMRVSDVVAFGTTATAFSWHTEGRQSSVTDSVVFDSYGVLGARGLYNSMSDVAGSGNQRGIQIFEYGDGDGSHIGINNVQLRATSYYGYTTVGNVHDNVITNSIFETLDKKVWIANGVSVSNTLNKLVSTLVQSGAPAIVGTDSDDRLMGTIGADVIQGGAGTDYIWGGLGADILTGGAGSDRFAYLSVAEAGDVITDFQTGLGGDTIDLSVIAIQNGWKGNIFGGGYVAAVQSGSDTLLLVDANGGANSWVNLATLRNVSAPDLQAHISTNIHVTGTIVAPSPTAPAAIVAAPAVVEAVAPVVDSYPDALRLTVNGTLTGTSGADVMIGTALNDRLLGGDGDDLLIGGAGADALFGGTGFNTASYETAATGLIVDLVTPSLNSGDAAGDSYSGIAGITGSAFADRLYGNASANTIKGGAGDDLIDGRTGADWLYGGDGNDTLIGGTESDRLSGDAGNDRLVGGLGYDTLTGGAGADRFVLEVTGDRTWDTITDFVHGEDHIVLLNLGLSALNATNFVASAAPRAIAAVGTVLYNTNDGSLFWDADGTGSAAAVKIGLLQNHPVLTASDFLFG